MKLLLLLAFSLMMIETNAQTFRRLETESAEQFSERILNTDTFARSLLEINAWEMEKPLIIAFVPYGLKVAGFLLLPGDSAVYQKILIDTLQADCPWGIGVYLAVQKWDLDRKPCNKRILSLNYNYDYWSWSNGMLMCYYCQGRYYLPGPGSSTMIRGWLDTEGY